MGPSGRAVAVALCTGAVVAVASIAAAPGMPGPPAAEVRALSLLPIAVPDTLAMKHDRTATVPAPGVLANDVDLIGGSKAVLDDGPDHGTLSLNGDGGYTYRPNAGYVGTDVFRYHATGIPSSNTTTVTITIANAAPIALPDAYSVAFERERRVDEPGVLANDSDVDGDPLTASLVNGPAHGELELRGDGEVRYTPDDGYVGLDAFSYRVWDGLTWSLPATVALTIGGPAPTAPPSPPPTAPSPTPTPTPTPPPAPSPPATASPLTPPASRTPATTATVSPPSSPSPRPYSQAPDGSAEPAGVGVPGGPDSGEPPGSSSPGGAASGERPDRGPFTVGGSDTGGAIDLSGTIDASVGIELVVPGLLLTVPGLLLVLAILGQVAAGTIWLPLARRWLRGLGVARGRTSSAAGRGASPAA